MNFLGMGPMELLLIVVLALIVFGPDKLPEIMAQVGRVIGDFRRATSELSDEFNRTIQAELNETKQTIEETKSALTEVRSAVDSTMNETRAAVTGLPAPQRVAAPASTVETNGITHDEASGNGSSPPLADTSQWSWETSPSQTEAAEAAAVDVAAPSDASAAADVSAPGEVASAGDATRPAEEGTQAGSLPRPHVDRDELLPPY